MAVITVAALIVMVITTTLAITAVIARNDAERRQKQAEELVGFMLGDLNDKLHEVSRLDILEAVDDKAMAYFQSLPTTDVTEEALEQRAKALEKIGSVRFDQGHLQAAMESYQGALALSGTLAKAAPKDAARQIAYSRVWSFIGMAQWFQGKLDEAQSSFEAAQGVVRTMESAAATPALIYQLLVLDNNLGHVLEARGKMEEAENQYREMLARAEALVARKDVTNEWKSQLGAAHNNLGKVALSRGDLATAIAEYRADDAIVAELSARDPRNNDARFEMFTVRAILGRTLALAGDTEGGVRAFRQAVDIATQLTAQDPTYSGVQENLALYRMQLGRLLRLTGKLSEAIELTQQSLEAFTTLTKQDSENANWQRELAEVQTERARQYQSAGQKKEASALAQVALDSLDPLLSKRPSDRSLLLATVNARLLCANVSADEPARQRMLGEALAAIEAVKSGASDPRLLALRVEVLLGLARRDEAHDIIQKLWDSGYRDPALVALLQHADIDYPVNTEFQKRLEHSSPQQRT
jgi:tetratricopeptide (TPR) repeat protein